MSFFHQIISTNPRIATNDPKQFQHVSVKTVSKDSGFDLDKLLSLLVQCFDLLVDSLYLSFNLAHVDPFKI